MGYTLLIIELFLWQQTETTFTLVLVTCLSLMTCFQRIFQKKILENFPVTYGKGQHGNIFYPVVLLEHTDCWTENLLLSDAILGYSFNYSPTTKIVFHIGRRAQGRREPYSYGWYIAAVNSYCRVHLPPPCLLIYVDVATQNYLIISLYLILFTPTKKTGKAPLFSYFSFPLAISEIFSIKHGLSK